MYWKYHLESGDLVKFAYDHPEHGGMIVWGTIIGMRDEHDTEPESTDEVDFEKINCKIESGQETVWVPLSDIKKRTKKEDRDTDLPQVSERLRFSGGISEKVRERERRSSDSDA